MGPITIAYARRMAQVELAETYVFRLRDGKVVEVREFRTLDEAYAALP